MVLLGSTGSIGVQSIEVINHLNTLADSDPTCRRFKLVGLSAGSNQEQLLEQAHALAVKDIAICQSTGTTDHANINLRIGQDASRRLINEIECDLVIGAIVGIAGLDAILEALNLGIDIALANKETLVAAGALVIKAARRTGANILPVDSEHAGVWQCLQAFSHSTYAPPMPLPPGVKKITLTASGGPFRNASRQDIHNANIADALNHPNWSMGAKVTIDSATLMNKALELIEAHWLFGLAADQLDAIIHPQSIVHAFIESIDGSVLAQLGAPDMKAPIQHAIAFPTRQSRCAASFDIAKLSTLDFCPIDPARFPAINLAMSAINEGQSAGAILNAANEQAVNAYLQSLIPFGQIDQCVIEAMNTIERRQLNTIDDVYAADQEARVFVAELCAKQAERIR